MRIGRLDFESYLSNAASNLGASEMEVELGQVYQVPDGQSAPTQPGRQKAPDAPKGRTGLGVLSAAVRAACSLYNPNPGGFIDQYLDFSEYTNSVSVADALMRQVCGAPPDDTPGPTPSSPPLAPTPPFSGGQCPGEDYEVSYTLRYGADPNNPVTDQRTSSRTWIGPIGSVIGPIPGSNSSAFSWDLTHDLDNPNGPRRNQLAGVGSQFTPSLSGVSPVRKDGNPDNCGDPPVEPTNDPSVPMPGPKLPPFSFDPGDGGAPETYEPDVSIEPGPDGPAIRFRFPDGDYYVDPGGVTVVPEGIPQPCCSPDAPAPDPEEFQPSPADDPPEPPPDGVPEEDPATEEEEATFVAVVVTANNVSTPASAIGSLDGGPIVYAPRLGSLQFRIDAGGGASGWTSDINIKNAQQYVPVPVPQGAVDVRVFPYGATQFRVQRIYKQVQAPIGGPSS